MHINWSNETDEPEFPTGWAIPLDEPAESDPSILPLPSPEQRDQTPDPASFLLQGSDPAPGDEFHPRLRRFGEAA